MGFYALKKRGDHKFLILQTVNIFFANVVFCLILGKEIISHKKIILLFMWFMRILFQKYQLLKKKISQKGSLWNVNSIKMHWVIREDDIYFYLWLTDKMRRICVDFLMRYLLLAKSLVYPVYCLHILRMYQHIILCKVNVEDVPALTHISRGNP